jgi:hypothetical protein
MDLNDLRVFERVASLRSFSAAARALGAPKSSVSRSVDQRLLTLDDTVEFFNLVLGDKLTAQEKQDLVAFMRAL